MKNTICECVLILVALLLISLLGTSQVMGQEEEELSRDRRAQTGMKFLSVSVDARAAAMADAMTAQRVSSSIAMFYNPAGMAYLDGTVDVSVGQLRYHLQCSQRGC